jgi:hypothetical protein
MGMLANLWVRPAQNRLPDGTNLNGHLHSNSDYNATTSLDDSLVGDTYVYNDGDGTTLYDVEEAIQVSSFDGFFHDASLFVQPLPFAMLESNYPMINGRGYPDTVAAGPMPAPTDNTAAVAGHDPGKVQGGGVLNNGTPTQLMDSVITVTSGDDLLLRLSNVSIERFFTLTATGLTMKIVGTGARQMRGPSPDGVAPGKNIYREVASVNFGGGETHDVIIETSNVAPGTYFLHSAELHQMSNLTQLDGGMITEIVVE